MASRFICIVTIFVQSARSYAIFRVWMTIHHTRRPKGAIRFIELLSLPHLINGHFFVTPYLIGCLIKFTYFPLQLSRNRCICRCWFASASCWSIVCFPTRGGDFLFVFPQMLSDLWTNICRVPLSKCRSKRIRVGFVSFVAFAVQSA